MGETFPESSEETEGFALKRGEQGRHKRLSSAADASPGASHEFDEMVRRVPRLHLIADLGEPFGSMHDGKAEFYSGNYSFYMEEKQARFDLQMKQYEQEQAKLKQLGYTVERMKGWGINNRTLYRRAMSIQHRMERIQKTERPKAERTMKASFGEKDFSGDVVFKMKNVSKSFGDRVLFSDVNLNVEGGERIALLGDNGTGKSTFIKCLLGEEDCQGKIQFGPTVKWGYLPQIIHFDHPERSLYDKT